MKNLQLVTISTKDLPKSPINASHVACNEDTIYLIIDKKLYKSYNDTETLVSDETYECITPLEFLTFENKLWFGTGHEFISYCPESELITRILLEDEFLCATWNPTQEALAVVFANSDVATFNIDYESGIALRINRSNLQAAVPQTVYVGWGSANTQFRGSEGKLKPNSKPEVAVKEVDDRLPRITWRGNGEMFAVNYWRDGRRTFKVFEYPCSPLFECEDIPGLQCAIAWRPEGNMIANPVNMDDCTSMFIFEKNGYKRFQFALQFSNHEVQEVKWSPGGEILAILQKTDKGETHLSLYTTSNYKWYLKQYMHFPVTQQLISFDWTTCTRSLFTLRIITSLRVVTYVFKHVVCVSNATVAVIDGPTLHLTSFRHVTMPPPMSGMQLAVVNPINFAAFHPNATFLAVIDSECNCTVYENVEDEWKKIGMKKISGIVSGSIPISLYHFHWRDRRLCFVSPGDVEDGQYSIFGFDVDGLETNEIELCKSIDKKIIPNLTQQLLQFDNIVAFEENDVQLSLDLPANSVKVVTRKISKTLVTFSLTSTNAFFVDEKTVANNVTSFCIHDSYLLITMSNSRLYCVRLVTSKIEKLKSTSLDEFFSRPIEQGGVIFCGIPSTSTVVLQIPRGNLEIVSCRIIAIDLLEKLLDEKRWQEALRFIRTDRLNSNLLVDLNPDRFLCSIGMFVDACETAAVLNAFCQEIDDTNVLTSVYQKCWVKQPQELPDKCRIVCRAILRYLEQVDYSNYITTIMVINVYHFTTEDALIYVQDLLERSKTEREMLQTATKAVKTLNTHTKGEDLYLKALSLYDTDLAKFVASYSQMDPKFYEPFLNELSELSEVTRRFKINMHLKKPKVAVLYLLRNDGVPPEEVLEFIKAHDVVEVAHNHLSSDSVLFKDVSKLLGEKLAKKLQHVEAGVVFANAGLWAQAYEEYKMALDWRSAISCVNKVDLPDIEKYRMIQEIAEELAKGRKATDAARVYEEYLKNYEAAISVLIDGYVFREALFLAEKYKRPDVIEADIMSAVQKYISNLILRLTEAENTFNAHKTRLETLRKDKIVRYKNVGESQGDDDVDDNLRHDIDLFSDAGSQATTKSTRTSGSRMSTLSSRNRRKEERKKQDLRVGGVYEDIALIRALYNLITEIFQMSSDVRDVCLVLIQRNLKVRAAALQKLLGNIQETVMKSIKTIWPETFNEHHKCDNIEAEAINENILTLDETYRKPPQLTASNWHISIIDTLIQF